MKMKLLSLFVILSLACYTSCYGQTDISAQVQIYPTGLIPGIKFDHSVSQHGRISIRLGANIFDHGDQGVQDEEEGAGFGFSLGYQYYFIEDKTGLHLELKNDIWWNNVDWFDNELSIGGETDIIVVQPTINLGYTFMLGDLIAISPSIGFGLEWNVRTDGEPTGEGPIGLIGISAGIRI